MSAGGVGRPAPRRSGGLVRRGRLLDRGAAPDRGERTQVVADLAGARVEEILSSDRVEPLPYDQDHDEWVVVLDGAATLDVAGQEVALGPGDWVLLPARTPHRVVRTEAGTRWLAVHAPPDPGRGPAA